MPPRPLAWPRDPDPVHPQCTWSGAVIAMPSDFVLVERTPLRSAFMTDVDQLLSSGELRPVRVQLDFHDRGIRPPIVVAQVVRVGDTHEVFGDFVEDVRP